MLCPGRVCQTFWWLLRPIICWNHFHLPCWSTSSLSPPGIVASISSWSCECSKTLKPMWAFRPHLLVLRPHSNPSSASHCTLMRMDDILLVVLFSAQGPEKSPLRSIIQGQKCSTTSLCSLLPVFGKTNLIILLNSGILFSFCPSSL